MTRTLGRAPAAARASSAAVFGPPSITTISSQSYFCRSRYAQICVTVPPMRPASLYAGTIRLSSTGSVSNRCLIGGLFQPGAAVGIDDGGIQRRPVDAAAKNPVDEMAIHRRMHFEGHADIAQHRGLRNELARRREHGPVLRIFKEPRRVGNARGLPPRDEQQQREPEILHRRLRRD